GKWVSTKDLNVEFREDGTCLIGEKELFFEASLYKLSTGDSKDTIRYTHNIVYLTNNSMTLREEATKKLYKLTRVD
ncbi:MAG: hypothetical protein Q4E07_03170, partial [Eubacteriales bacterium]|nr:hypothetical protein [Eubacteriales bacterium]